MANMALKVTQVNSVDKLFVDNENIVYRFPQATVTVNTATTAITVLLSYAGAVSSTTKFADLTNNYGAADAEAEIFNAVSPASEIKELSIIRNLRVMVQVAGIMMLVNPGALLNIVSLNANVADVPSNVRPPLLRKPISVITALS